MFSLISVLFPSVVLTAAQLLEIMRRLEARGAETIALQVRQWVSAIFRYAVVTQRADSDPAAALKGAVTRPKVKHSKPLSRADIPCLINALNAYGGYPTTAIAVRLLLLTFVRTIELRAAQWTETDFNARLWRIPAERMKMKEAHSVPLSRQAVEVMQQLHALTGHQQWLFPNYRRLKTYMSATTINEALRRIGFYGGDSIGFSAHGFRATACTILNEMGYRPDIIERQLAHQECNSVRASYNRAEYLDDRRKMMQEWADVIDDMVKGQGKAVLP